MGNFAFTECEVTAPTQEKVSDHCLDLGEDLYSSGTNMLSGEAWRAGGVEYLNAEGHTLCCRCSNKPNSKLCCFLSPVSLLTSPLSRSV